MGRVRKGQRWGWRENQEVKGSVSAEGAQETISNSIAITIGGCLLKGRARSCGPTSLKLLVHWVRGRKGLPVSSWEEDTLREGEAEFPYGGRRLKV